MRYAALTTLMFAGTLCACASQPDPSQTSHISGASFRDVSALTVFIADILATTLPPASTTLRVLPLDGPDPDQAAFLLDSTLRERGFALAPGGMAYPGSHTLRYGVAPLGQNLMLELDVDDASTTCLYAHSTSGSLRHTGTCTSRDGTTLALRIPAAAVPESEPVAIAGASPPITNRSAAAARFSGPIPIAPTLDTPSHPTMPVTPAPSMPLAPPPLPAWVLVRGQPIRDQMLAWGDKAGWTVIWPTDREMNWIVPVTTSFTGRFDDKESGPLAQVIRTLVAEDKPLKLDLYYPNRTAVISNTGVAQ